MKCTTMILLAATLLVAFSGCESPEMQKRIAQRERNIDRTLRHLAEREETCGDRMDRTVQQLARMHERNVTKSRENPEKVRQWLQDDVDQWEAREPMYRELIGEYLGGEPDNIEPTLIEALD